MDAEEIALRAKMRHDSLMARRERADALRRDLTSLRADLRMLSAEMQGKVLAMATRAAELAGRLSFHLRELDQEDTTIRLPALEPRLAPTERIARPGDGRG